MAIQHIYREINKFLNWEHNKDGFNKATSQMREILRHKLLERAKSTNGEFSSDLIKSN